MRWGRCSLCLLSDLKHHISFKVLALRGLKIVNENSRAILLRAIQDVRPIDYVFSRVIGYCGSHLHLCWRVLSVKLGLV